MLVGMLENTVGVSGLLLKVASRLYSDWDTWKLTWRTGAAWYWKSQDSGRLPEKETCGERSAGKAQERSRRTSTDSIICHRSKQVGYLEITMNSFLGNTMPINLSKGQKVDLTKGNPGLEKYHGWSWLECQCIWFRCRLRLDAAAFMLGTDGKCPTDKRVYAHGNLVHQSESKRNIWVINNRREREAMTNRSRSIFSSTSKHWADPFTVTIYEAEPERQNFGQVSNAFIRLVDETTGRKQSIWLGRGFLHWDSSRCRWIIQT